MSRYQEYRMKEIINYLHKTRRFVSVSLVAKSVEVSWNTAKIDLDALAREGLVEKKGKGYRFKF